MLHQQTAGGRASPLHAIAGTSEPRETVGSQPGRPDSAGPAHDWRRRLSAIRQGLTTYGAAAAAHEHLALASALRARQTRPRRIAVIGSNGGVGTTTAAVLLASVVSAAREDQTLLLTLHSDAADVAARLAVPHAPSVSEVLAGLHRHGRIPPTPVTRTGLRVLSAPPAGSPAIDAGLAGLLEVAAVGHATVVVDAGVASRIGSLANLAELFDTVVLVCGIGTDSIQARNTILARWAAQLPSRQATRLILVPIRSRPGARGPGTDPVEQLPVDGITTHEMAHDPELARGRAIDLGLVSGASMATALAFGADILGHR